MHLQKLCISFYFINKHVQVKTVGSVYILPTNTRIVAARCSVALMPHFSAHCCSRCCALLQEIHELKDQIQDVEIKYTQNLKEVKVSV